MPILKDTTAEHTAIWGALKPFFTKSNLEISCERAVKQTHINAEHYYTINQWMSFSDQE